MTEEQLSALLRCVKRHEQPPPGYFDQLLRDIHRRQRSELLRRPLWQIAIDRVQTFFGEHSMSPASYATAMATVLVVGVAAIGVLSPSRLQRQEMLTAQNAPQNMATPQPQSLQQSLLPQPQSLLPQSQRTLTLQQPVSYQQNPLFHGSQQMPAAGAQQLQPVYILDSRPPTYERTSISF